MRKQKSRNKLRKLTQHHGTHSPICLPGLAFAQENRTAIGLWNSEGIFLYLPLSAARYTPTLAFLWRGKIKDARLCMP